VALATAATIIPNASTALLDLSSPLREHYRFGGLMIATDGERCVREKGRSVDGVPHLLQFNCNGGASHSISDCCFPQLRRFSITRRRHVLLALEGALGGSISYLDLLP
jgi:hypothetical protein